jgi:PAS domain S-box-containing protein
MSAIHLRNLADFAPAGLLLAASATQSRRWIQSFRGVYALLISALIVVLLVATGVQFLGGDRANLKHLVTESSGLIILGLLLALVLVRRNMVAERADSQLRMRHNAIERMDDGWMLLDRNNRVVDINPAGAALLGQSSDAVINNHLADLLDGEALVSSGDRSDLDVKIGARPGSEPRYINLRSLPLGPCDPQQPERLVFWHDITEKRKAEAATRQSRDGLLVVLHSLSRAAGELNSQQEFLEFALRQVIYSLHSEVGIIWLFTEGETGDSRLETTAYLGLSENELSTLDSSIRSPVLWGLVSRLDQPSAMPIAGLGESQRPELPGLEHKTSWIVPMLVGADRIGLLWIGRDDVKKFGSDELMRASILANEAAALVFFQRQRQVAIVGAERQRMMRELHDSVTQRLYGLVALTEAAQLGAARQPGQSEPQILERIGENARQAIKEMRLFLHQLQPLDFERDGLVGLLRKRLAAVEGRSDVMVEFTSDPVIPISARKQRALYYIAQEALNNALRHAFAKRVSLQLSSSKGRVTFQIADDGKGFSTRRRDKSGLGLVSMRSRAAEIGARLSIKSAPGKGTTILVRLPAETSKISGRDTNP